MTAFSWTNLKRKPAPIFAVLGLIMLTGCNATDNSANAGDAMSSTNTVSKRKPTQTTVTVEEERVNDALLALIDQSASITTDLQFAPLAGPAMLATSAAKRDTVLQRAQSAGNKLWVNATQLAKQSNMPLDDRALYWRRLLEKREFKTACNNPKTHAMLCTEMLAVFEQASRGTADLQFTTPKAVDNLHIVVSGFDPFGLDDNIDQSNPSGAAALALDGVQLNHNGITAEIQAVMFPVRFADFDDGMVEAIFEPLVTSGAIDMLVTISMGRSEFDLERFPGRRRSATAPDNLRVRTGASGTNPLIPQLAGDPLTGPEFVEFSLPVAALRAVQTPYPVNDNRTVTTLENGEHRAATLEELNTQTAVRGSGGGYLSNEISYRTVRLVQSHNAKIAVGHIHTPRISAYDDRAVLAISAQIRAMLVTALNAP